MTSSAPVRIPIVGPDGGHERWFVPTVEGDRLVGFRVLGLDEVEHRSSRFGSPAPAADDWLDEATIVRRARTASSGSVDAPPVLSYDGSPERLAWRVVVGGQTVFVAGEAAWVGR